MAPGTTAARLEKNLAGPLDSAPHVSYIADMRRAIGQCARWQKGHIMSTTKTEAQRIEAIRAALRAKYGKGKHRITGHIGINEQIHVYSQMPNSIETGWWLMGDMIEAELRLGLES